MLMARNVNWHTFCASNFVAIIYYVIVKSLRVLFVVDLIDLDILFTLSDEKQYG